MSNFSSRRDKNATIGYDKFLKILIACGIGYEDLKSREWFIEEIEPHKYHCAGYHPTLLRMDVIKDNIVV